jgi:hypothetical protein
MKNTRSFKLCGQRIILSNNTLDALTEHECFVSAGEKWLIENDPNGALEAAHLEQIDKFIRIDVEEAIKHLSHHQQDTLLDQLNEMSTVELFDLCT